MTQDNPTPTGNPQDEAYFQAQHEKDIRLSNALVKVLRAICKKYNLPTLNTAVDKLEELPEVAEEMPDEARVTALVDGLRPFEKDAKRNSLQILKTILAGVMSFGFADADNALAVESGATSEEKQKMDQEDQDLSKSVTDDGHNANSELESELTILILSLIGPYIEEQVADIRAADTSSKEAINQGRKTRAIANEQTVAACLIALVNLVGKYSLSDSNISTELSDQQALFKAAARDKTDPKVTAFLAALEQYADCAADDTITVVENAAKGFVAFMFAQAACTAMKKDGASEADINQLTNQLNSIIMAAMEKGTSEKLGQITVLGAALMQKPLAEALARRAR